MIDTQYLRDNPEKVKQASKDKGYNVSPEKIIELDDARKSLQQQIDELRTERNAIADSIKRVKGKPDEALVERGRQLKFELGVLEEDYAKNHEEFITLLKAVPNMPAEDVPVGV